MPYVVTVSELLADPGSSRTERGSVPVSVALPNAAAEGEGTFEATLRSLRDGVVARGTVAVVVDLVCSRCLVEWSETREIPFEQVYRRHPEDADDELPLIDGHSIDLQPAIHDEVSLSLPAAPTCRPDCAGLCSVCGSDLNVAPCDGHGEGSDSPFAVLKQLFDS